MRIAITGGTGFVGRHLADRLAAEGHQVVLVARGIDRRDLMVAGLPGVRLVCAGVTDSAALTEAFATCSAVVHCAGINREIGQQTYDRVHVQGTKSVIEAAVRAGVPRLAMLSFLRARPDGPSAYHRSKWAAEELVRLSGLRYTVVKAGVIYGTGDHMLDHLSHAFGTFPIFGLVGLRDRPVRPVAVGDVVDLLRAAALADDRLADRTIFALGPEQLGLRDAVRRVAIAAGRRPLMLPLPVRVHDAIAVLAEMTMRVPLVSRAQVRILSEGVVEPMPFADEPPRDLQPRTPFSLDVIRRGLPPPGGFSRSDLRWCSAQGSAR